MLVPIRQPTLQPDGDFACQEKAVADKDGILVATADSSVIIKELKVEGKKKMSAEDYLRGHKIEKGTKIGN